MHGLALSTAASCRYLKILKAHDCAQLTALPCELGDGIPPPVAVLPDMLQEQLVLLAGPRAFPPPVVLHSPAARDLPVRH